VRELRIASLVLTALLLAGCATGPTSPVSSPSATPSRTADARTGAELSGTFGACVPGVEYDWGGPPLDFVAELYPWRRVADLLATEPYGAAPETFVVATIVDGAGARRTLLLRLDALPGIHWALANGGEVWVGLDGPTQSRYEYEHADTTMVLMADDAFFPGECTTRIYEAAHEQLGDDPVSVLRTMTTTDDADSRRALLGVVDAEPEPEPSGPVILNPETAPRGLLDSLRPVAINLRIAEPIASEDGLVVICTHIPAGWADCVPTEMAARGVSFGGYTDESGVVEFWLIDEPVGVERPLGYLGSVDVGDRRQPSIKLVVSTDIDPSSLPSTSTGGDPGLLDVVASR
jgi:hypothetical protein